MAEIGEGGRPPLINGECNMKIYNELKQTIADSSDITISSLNIKIRAKRVRTLNRLKGKQRFHDMITESLGIHIH